MVEKRQNRRTTQTTHATAMTTTQPIHVGQKIPSFVFFTMKDDTPTTITSDEVFLGTHVCFSHAPR